MSRQAVVDRAVKQCYQEYQNTLKGYNSGFVRKKCDSAKDYTIAWFSVWWNDVKVMQLQRAIEKAEVENVVQP